MKQLLLATSALVALGGQALAADMRMPVKAPPTPAPAAYSWTGCSIGGHIGAGWAHTTWSDPNASGTFPILNFPGGTIDDTAKTSVLGGAQVGCDYQFDPHWVVGAGGDFSWTNIEGQVNDPFFGGKPLGLGPLPIDAKTEWLATATARVGYAFDRVLLYARGGAAWSHDKYSVQNGLFWGTPPSLCVANFTSVPCNANGSATRTGWIVGLGFEWAFAGNWTAGVEFDHYDFGTSNITLTDPNAVFPAPISIKQTNDAAKVTLNYRFGPHW
jgi:outer membrane immunogenic protein